MWSRRSSMVVGGVGLVLALALTWLQRGVVAAWWWSAVVAPRALSVDDARAVADCGALSWSGVVQLLEQDAELPCGEAWFARHASASAAGHAVRRRWLVAVALSLPASPRERARAAAASLLAAPADRAGLLSLIVTAPQGDGRVAEAMLTVGEEREVEGVVWHPELAWRAAIGRLERGDDASVRLVVEWLRGQALERTVDVALVRRAVRAGLEHYGTGVDGLQDLVVRHRQGLPVDAPAWSAVLVANRGASCEVLESPACCSFVADLLDAAPRAGGMDATWSAVPGAEVGDLEERLPAFEAVDRLWAAEGWSEAQRADGASLLTEVALWVGSLRERERGGAVLAAVASPGPWGPTPPLALLGARRGAAATAALVALAIAGEGVEVEVRDVGGGALALASGDHLAVLGRCGEWADRPADGSRGEVLTLEAIAARVAAERALQWGAEGDPVTASRLERLAIALDPAWGSGVVEATAPGARAGELLAPGLASRTIERPSWAGPAPCTARREAVAAEP